MKTYFISGHRNLSTEDFKRYYIPKIEKALEDESSKFVIGDYQGVDFMAQCYLRDHLKNHKRVTVYHMYDSPRNLASKLFNTIGGFTEDTERDSAMTKASDEDIAFIEKGRWTSGTAQNILRRFEL